ncbi:MAG: anti-sigma factor [Cyclobacteriaceae bacterium]
MNVEEYISTGVLEAYVLGELTPTQRLDVESKLRQEPALMEELRVIELTLEAFVQRGAIKPGEGVRSGLLSKLDVQKKAKVVPISSQGTKLAIAASVAIALLTSYLSYYYYGQYQQTSQTLGNLVAQSQQLAQDYSVVNDRLDKMQNDLSIMGSAAFSRIIMKGTENAPNAMASVYWNSATEEVYLSIHQMKALTQESQYQLWAIVEGKPVNAGVFDMNPGGLLAMKSVSGASAFAVTVEPRGGMPTPNMATMQVIGTMPKT